MHGQQYEQQQRQKDAEQQPAMTVQIFVNVDEFKACPMDVSLSGRVGDVLKRISNSACCSERDVYVTCERRLLETTGGETAGSRNDAWRAWEGK